LLQEQDFDIQDFDIKILRSTNFLKYDEIVDEFYMTATGQRKFY